MFFTPLLKPQRWTKRKSRSQALIHVSSWMISKGKVNWNFKISQIRQKNLKRNDEGLYP